MNTNSEFGSISIAVAAGIALGHPLHGKVLISLHNPKLACFAIGDGSPA